MANLDVGAGGGRKRSVDQEINMIPFIDLLMVTISFLLITAVWSSMARLTASAQEPGTIRHVPPAHVQEPSVLHVRVSEKDHRFVLQWQRGNQLQDYTSIEMTETNGRYLQLEEEVKKAYQVGQQTQHLYGDDLAYEESAQGEHGANTLNAAILHFDNGFAFKDVVRVIDAVYGPRRFVCAEAKPTCCGKPDAAGHSTEGCEDAALDVPAFNVAFSSN